MRLSFPYPEIKSLEVPEQNLFGVFSPSTVRVEKSEEDIIEEALSCPIGSPTSFHGLKRLQESTDSC